MPTQEVEVDQKLEVNQEAAVEIVLMAITDPKILKALATCPQFIQALQASQPFMQLINKCAGQATGSTVAAGITR
jgi:hypothetical protein